jgi:porphobilinogen synthase
MTLQLTSRPRRNRISPAIRGLIQETHILPQHLVSCFFVIEGINQRYPIPSMPGVERLSINLLLKEIALHYALGVRAIDLFAYLERDLRDALGSAAYQEGNLLQKAILAVKKEFPDLCVMADIALDPYTDHGHDGAIDANGYVINDLSVELLGKMSLIAAEAGADLVAPSDMMDGRVGYIRQLLDQEGFQRVGIVSYTAKYISSLYGPFRGALDSAPQIGNKKNYQMNPANKREALREATLDIQEGADMLLIKPALCNLDIIAAIRQESTLPIGAYHISGEYSMIMAAAERGWIDAPKVFYEQMLSIRRAGADFIFTYAAKQICQGLTEATH